MKTINIQAAKTHLSRLVEEVASGEEVIIAKSGKPMAKIVPLQLLKKPRIGGQLKGQFKISPAFWDPDEDIIKQMTEGPLYPETRPKSEPKAAENVP